MFLELHNTDSVLHNTYVLIDVFLVIKYFEIKIYFINLKQFSIIIVKGIK